MKFILEAIYVKRKVRKKINITYDKTGKIRPAWVQAKGLPEGTAFLRVRLNDRHQHYRAWMTTRIPLFLPTDYTSEELRKYYDKFSKLYEPFVVKKNKPAAKFLVSRLKLPKNANILDLGAGTGLVSEELAKAGYSDITLLDYSAKMLALAKKKKSLKNCKFIRQDIRNLKSWNKFDCIISVFSFAYSAYYKPGEMAKLWKLVHRALRPKGTLALFAHDYNPPTKLFKKVEAKTHLFAGEYKIPYYIGVKR